jgi:phage baseplate assembly protein gpV
MFREVKSRTFLNMKDSDIASQLAGEYGLSTEVDSTTEVYKHVFQHNQTDLAFLVQRAWRIGYECFVDDGKLYFRKPPNVSGGIELAWGEDLVSFQPNLSLADKVSEVNVRGWDITKQEAIVGKATSDRGYPSVNVGGGAAAISAKAFGAAKKILVDLPVQSQADADSVAQARMDQLGGELFQATGVAFRRPDIRAGKTVKLTKLGNRFSGSYMVTRARHIYRSDGLRTEFEVTGSNSGLLNEQLVHQPPVDRWPGVVVAKVTNTDDPEDIGRVKVKYPWLTDDAESFWARVICPGAGPERGLFIMPQVDDEVMVAFEHGDFDRPYVLGGVWNGQQAVPAPGAGAGSGEKPLVRTWYSETGHHISVYDNADKKIEIITAGGHKLVLDDANQTIELTSIGGAKLVINDQSNTVDLESKGPLNVKSTHPMSIKSDATLTVEGTSIDIKASGPLNLKGAVVNIN